MPWRFLVFLVVFGVFLAFITFNLDNKCDISFGFTVIPNVPVFLTVFISYVLGLLCSMPFIFRAGLKRAKIPVKDKKGNKEDEENKGYKENNEDKDNSNRMKNSMKERRFLFQKKHKSPSEGNPYDADN